jgi:hypothetical protein
MRAGGVPDCPGLYALYGSLQTGRYANPFAHTTNLVPRRFDMGVEYDGQGEIDALGNARITFAGTAIGGGWTCNTAENGGIVYQLTDGPDHGRYIYLTEDIIPNVTTGQHVTPDSKSRPSPRTAEPVAAKSASPPSATSPPIARLNERTSHLGTYT